MLEYINHTFSPNADEEIIKVLEIGQGPQGISLRANDYAVPLYPDPRSLDTIAINKLLNVGEPCGPLDAPRLASTSNRVAAETRRGAGNTLIYHPSDKDLIEFKVPDYFLKVYKRYEVAINNLRGRVILRYNMDASRFQVAVFDGTPIMVVGKKRSDVLAAPALPTVGFHITGADKFVKVFTL